MLKPTNDWVVTKVVEIEEKNDNLIRLVTNDKDETKYVEILSFGPEANKYGDLKVGDIVMVPTKSGIKTRHEDVEYEMAKEKNFLGVYEKGEWIRWQRNQ
jgi:co-chaperonin GroES (HSP10)